MAMAGASLSNTSLLLASFWRLQMWFLPSRTLKSLGAKETDCCICKELGNTTEAVVGNATDMSAPTHGPVDLLQLSDTPSPKSWCHPWQANSDG